MKLCELLCSRQRIFYILTLLVPLDTSSLSCFWCFWSAVRSRCAELLGCLPPCYLCAYAYLLRSSCALFWSSSWDESFRVIDSFNGSYRRFVLELFDASEIHRFGLTFFFLFVFNSFSETIILKLSKHFAFLNLLNFILHFLYFISITL